MKQIFGIFNIAGFTHSRFAANFKCLAFISFCPNQNAFNLSKINFVDARLNSFIFTFITAVNDRRNSKNNIGSTYNADWVDQDLRNIHNKLLYTSGSV